MKKYDIMILSGAFDPLKIGHIQLIKAAKALAYKVIVGINSDEWIVRNRANLISNFKERSIIVSYIKSVDEIMRFNDKDDTAIELLTRVQKLYPECNIAFGNGGKWSE